MDTFWSLFPEYTLKIKKKNHSSLRQDNTLFSHTIIVCWILMRGHLEISVGSLCETNSLWLNISQCICGPGKQDVAQFHINLLFSRLLQSAAVQMVFWRPVIWNFFKRWMVFFSCISPADPHSDLHAFVWLWVIIELQLVNMCSGIMIENAFLTWYHLMQQ